MTDRVQLSDGNLAEIPDGTDPADIPKLAAQAEAQLADMYGKQAAAKNAPVTAGSKIYSATTVYPNSVMGHAMAWLDHNAGGNWLNRNVVQPVDNWQTQHLGGQLEAPIGRAESNAIAGVVDLPGAVVNTVKHYTPMGTDYDVPSLAGAIRGETGVPELSPDAPFWQRVAEAGMAGTGGMKAWANETPSILSTLRNFGLATTGTAGSDLGAMLFGEGGSLIGSLIGGGALPGGKLLAKTVAPGVRNPNAAGTTHAAEDIRPTTPGGNFQGLASQPPAGMPDYSDFRPSFTSLANPTGQRIASSLSSLPFSGAPIEAATERTRGFIQHARDAAATEMAGPRGLPTGGASAATIGPVLTEGAREAVLSIQREQQARQGQMDALMGGREVPVPRTILTGMNEVSNNQRGQAETAATLDRVNELRADAPGGSNYRRQPVPLPAIPSVPWSNLKDWVGNLTASLQSSGRPALPNDIAAALKAAANQERERAADAASPGAGAQFRQNNESYARALQHLDQLLPLSGEPLGASGRFADTPPEQRVAYAMTGKMQSPSDLEIFSHPAFPAEARLNAAGQHVSTLGNSSQGGFRPEKFVDEYRVAHPGLEELAHIRGQPLAALNVLNNASRLGENFSTPTSRFGLIKSLGAAAAVAKAMELTGKGIEYASGVPALKWIGTPALGRLYAEGLESEPVARAMAGQPQNWAETANRIPVIGANVDAREQDRQALRRKGTVTVTRP